MGLGLCQGTIPGDEGRLKRLRECEVCSIIGCKVRTEIPDARQKRLVRVTYEAQIHEILDGLAGALDGELSGNEVAPEHLSDLEIQEVRRMERFALGKDTCGDASP